MKQPCANPDLLGGTCSMPNQHQGACTSQPVVQITGPGTTPTRSHRTDAGFDLYVHKQTIIQPHEFADVDCGISISFPKGYWGRIVGRSSTLRTRSLLVIEGIIDEGYRGALFAGVWNLKQEAVKLEQGDRIAQLVLHETPPTTITMRRVEQLPPSDRGTSGFGSTGN
jgi:deoxyuridine 5'-triphosphate nucleotidohydrolase